MGISTIAVGASVTPSVIETWCSHYLNRKPRRQKPTAHISYDLGLHLMRQFLAFAGQNTVEDIQEFTSQWAPSPRWVKTDTFEVSQHHLQNAAGHIQAQLGPDGLHAVGGRTWWLWRQEDNPLKAEWIEMRKDHDLRKRRGVKCQRSMLYVHGGAYYFASVDAHRYQIQRHARKLQARVLAPKYRLAPQFPFPCGLLDCLATYLFLLTEQEPETIILAGDSAGGGMILSMLCILRDQGLPMPAGAILISPWVDLTHSFPSVAGTNNLDYVPADGFHHKPSASWPPPNADDLASLDEVLIEMDHGKQIPAKVLRQQARERIFQTKGKGREPANGTGQTQANGQRGPAHYNVMNPVVDIDGQPIEIKEQIQLYAPNELLSHPLVSPVLQSTLGGLPPLCILTGSGEMLRDEQIYLAHKAADPAAYPPPTQEDFAAESYRRPNLPTSDQVNGALASYPPTYVQLQIWDDLCHVATTLSWTRPAKYMFRSVAQFGAWALARAQMSEIRILDDDEVSVISTESSESVDSDDPASSKDSQSSRRSKRSSRFGRNSSSRERQPVDKRVQSGLFQSSAPATVGRAGDPLPLFKDHMIRQRVTRHGDIYNLDEASTLPACNIERKQVGSIKSGPVKKFLAVQKQLDSRFGESKRKFQAKRLQQMAETTGGRGMVFTKGREDSMLIGEEHPPPTALAGRTRQHIAEMGMYKKRKARISKGLAMWSGWGSKHDEEAIDKEDEKVRRKQDVTMSVINVRRRQSLNLLGTGPIAGGGPLNANHGGAEDTAGEGPSAEATSAREEVPAAEAQTAQGAEPSTHSQIPESSTAIAAPLAAAAGGAMAAEAAIRQDDHSNQLPPPATTIPSERVVSASNHPVVVNEPHLSPGIAPFKLARPDSLAAAQASTLTLDEADGVIQPDSATLPPPGHPHYSIASTITPYNRVSTASTATGQPSERLAVPGTIANEAPESDLSRPSTAGMGSSRPISPGGESTAESLVEAQPAQAQAVTMTHARAPSKGGLDAVALEPHAASGGAADGIPHANIVTTNGSGRPSVENKRHDDYPGVAGSPIDVGTASGGIGVDAGFPYHETMHDHERDTAPTGTQVVYPGPYNPGTTLSHLNDGGTALSEPEANPRDAIITHDAPEIGQLHGAEQTSGNIENAKEDSGDWAQGAMSAVADVSVETPMEEEEKGRERPGIERFVTAEQL